MENDLLVDLLECSFGDLVASDYFTAEVRSVQGLPTSFFLIVIDLATYRVTTCGTTAHPDESRMLQMPRNLLEPAFRFLHDKKQLIVDRDTKHSVDFLQALERDRIQVTRLPTGPR